MKTSKRLKLKMKHAELVKAGKYEVARKLLNLLNDGYVKLGRSNAVSLEAASICKHMGIPFMSRWAVEVYSL